MFARNKNAIACLSVYRVTADSHRPWEPLRQPRLLPNCTRQSIRQGLPCQQHRVYAAACVSGLQELGERVGRYRQPPISGMNPRLWRGSMPKLRLVGDEAQAQGGITYDRVISVQRGAQGSTVQLAPARLDYNMGFTDLWSPDEYIKVSPHQARSL